MTALLEKKKIRRHPVRETLTEAYEVRAFRDESEQPAAVESMPAPKRGRISKVRGHPARFTSVRP